MVPGRVEARLHLLHLGLLRNLDPLAQRRPLRSIGICRFCSGATPNWIWLSESS